MAHAHGSLCPPLPPGRMSWPHGALLFLWLFSPPLGAGGGGVALTSAAAGGSPPATSCPAACSCSNQASRVICTRRELAEVPASIPVNTRYLNLQENGIQVSRGLCGEGYRWWLVLHPEQARAFWVSPPTLHATPWTFTRCCLHPITLNQSYLGFLGHEAPCLCVIVLGPRQDHLPISHSGGQASAGPDLVLESQVVPRATLPQGLCAVCTAPSPALRGLRRVMA